MTRQCVSVTQVVKDLTNTRVKYNSRREKLKFVKALTARKLLSEAEKQSSSFLKETGTQIHKYLEHQERQVRQIPTQHAITASLCNKITQLRHLKKYRQVREVDVKAIVHLAESKGQKVAQRKQGKRRDARGNKQSICLSGIIDGLSFDGKTIFVNELKTHGEINSHFFFSKERIRLQAPSSTLFFDINGFTRPRHGQRKSLDV